MKTVKAAILVALKKEDSFEAASQSIIDYLRTMRHSQNWLCSFSRASQSEMHMKCHFLSEISFGFTQHGIEYIVKVAELAS